MAQSAERTTSCTRNWALRDLRQDLRHEVVDFLTRSGVFTAVSRRVYRDVIAMVLQPMAPLPCETFISRGMCRGLICGAGGVLPD